MRTVSAITIAALALGSGVGIGRYSASIGSTQPHESPEVRTTQVQHSPSGQWSMDVALPTCSYPNRVGYAGSGVRMVVSDTPSAVYFARLSCRTAR